MRPDNGTMRVRGQRQVLGKQTSTLPGCGGNCRRPPPHRPCGPDMLKRTAKRLQPVHRRSAMAGVVGVGRLGHFGFREGLEHGLPSAIAGVPERKCGRR